MAVDDFGTGYSSLAYLQGLDLDEIKVDRAFVRAMSVDGDDVLVRSIIELGHNLGLSVVAEGVEHPEQARPAARPRVRRRAGLPRRAADDRRAHDGLAARLGAARGGRPRRLTPSPTWLTRRPSSCSARPARSAPRRSR
nr:EAL domain-containing protein [Angustibacter aerolatus]